MLESPLSVRLSRSLSPPGWQGYAFVEYDDPAHADSCIAALNGLVIGDRTLTAARAKREGAPGGGAPGPISGGGLPAMFGGPAAPAAAYGAPPPVAAPSAAPTGVPSRVVILDHMVSEAELRVRGCGVHALFRHDSGAHPRSPPLDPFACAGRRRVP